MLNCTSGQEVPIKPLGSGSVTSSSRTGHKNYINSQASSSVSTRGIANACRFLSKDD